MLKGQQGEDFAPNGYQHTIDEEFGIGPTHEEFQPTEDGPNPIESKMWPQSPNLSNQYTNPLSRQRPRLGMSPDLDEAPDNAKTSLLYINTNNGYTEFETGEKVSSVANRLVTFPNNLYHTGTTNTCDEPFRCVVNIDWIPKGKSFE